MICCRAFDILRFRLSIAWIGYHVIRFVDFDVGHWNHFFHIDFIACI